MNGASEQPNASVSEGGGRRDGGMGGRLVVAALLGAVGLTVFWRGFTDLLWLGWHDPESSHLLLVPPLLVYMVVQRWGNITAARPGGPWAGLALLAGAVGTWEWGYREDMRIGGHLAVVLLVMGAWTLGVGQRAAWASRAALLLVLFLLPIPSTLRIQMSVPAQRVTAAVAEQVLLTAGADVTRAGSVMQVNGQQVGVAEACNGMRMLFAVVLIAYAYAVATPMRAWARTVVVLLSPMVALLANVVRVVLAAWVYGWADQGAAAIFHDLSGWAVAGLAFVVLWGSVSLAGWLGIDVWRRGDTAKAVSVAVGDGSVARGRTNRSVVMATVGVAVLAVGMGFNATHLSPVDAGDYHARIRAAAAKVPRTVGSYVGRDVEVPEAAVELLAANVLMARQYTDPQTRDGFTFVFVQCADARDMLGHYPEVCYPSQGWVSQGRERRETATGEKFNVFSFVRPTASAHLTLVQGFVVPDRGPATEVSAVQSAAGSHHLRHLGAAQWQLVIGGFASDQEVLEKLMLISQSQFKQTLMDVVVEVEEGRNGEQNQKRARIPGLGFW